ncbi:hypothetical protein [Pseudoxanthomonas kaohsiungensis]|uniref:Plasmid stability protein n=1 Tax=Pseudoxanthomonas kaohsiungensis TaxID=283923 RepID=A0ABW3LXD2_9GAMM|nr:hypothetical protein [Pseudoxanthomonas kaohsiungensis]
MNQDRIERDTRTHAERNEGKATRRLQFTLHRGPHESMFLATYDEVLGVLGHKAAGEFVARCVLVGAALMQPQPIDIRDLLEKLGRRHAGAFQAPAGDIDEGSDADLPPEASVVVEAGQAEGQTKPRGEGRDVREVPAGRGLSLVTNLLGRSTAGQEGK